MKRVAISATLPYKPAKAVSVPPRPAKTPVLCICWPPERDRGLWRIEVRGDRDRVSAKIVIPPIAGLEDDAAAILAEHWIRHRLPLPWHDLMLPGGIVADEVLIPWRPSDYWNQQADLSTLKGVLSLCQS